RPRHTGTDCDFATTPARRLAVEAPDVQSAVGARTGPDPPRHSCEARGARRRQSGRWLTWLSMVWESPGAMGRRRSPKAALVTVCAAAAFPAAAHGAATTVATDASPSLPSVVVVPGSVLYTAVDGVRRAGGSAASGPVIPFTGRLRRIAADPEGGRLVDWSLGASG